MEAADLDGYVEESRVDSQVDSSPIFNNNDDYNDVEWIMIMDSIPKESKSWLDHSKRAFNVFPYGLQPLGPQHGVAVHSLMHWVNKAALAHIQLSPLGLVVVDGGLKLSPSLLVVKPTLPDV